MAVTGYGFKPYKNFNNEDLMLCLAASGNSDILGVGDAVILAGDAGSIGNGKKVPTIARASAGDTNPIFGVVVSVDQNSLENNSNYSLSRRHRVASVATYVLVMPARQETQFLILPTAALATTDVGKVGNLYTISNADTTTGLSTMQINQATLAASGNATYQLRILGILDDDVSKTVGTDVLPAIVRINNIQAFHATAGL